MEKGVRELRNGDFLEVIFIGGTKQYFQIRKLDDVFYKDTHDSLASGSTESYTNIVNLDPPIDQLYCFFSVEIDGNVRLQLKHPAATNRWGTNRSPEGGYLFDLSSPVTSNRNIELWCSHAYPPSIQLINNTNVAIIPILWWIGKRFSVINVTQTPSQYTRVQVGGVAE